MVGDVGKMHLLDLFPVHEHKGANHDDGPDPVEDAFGSALDDQLAHQGQGNGQAQADGHDERAGQDHGVGPADIAEETGEAVDKEDGPDPSAGRELEGLDAQDRQDGEQGEQEDGVDEADQAEEKRHVQRLALFGCRIGRPFQSDGIDTVDECGECGHGVAEGQLGWGFVREGVTEALAFAIWLRVGCWAGRAGDVDPRYEEDAHKTCDHTDKFAPCELLDPSDRAYEESPDARSGCKNSGRGHCGVLEA